MASQLKAPTGVDTSDVTLVAAGTARAKVTVTIFNRSAAYNYLQLYISANTSSAADEQCGGANVAPYDTRYVLIPALGSSDNLLAKGENSNAAVCTVYEEG